MPQIRRNSGVTSTTNSAEPLSSHNSLDLENLSASIPTAQTADDSLTTPATPSILLDASLNASIFTSPETEASPQPVLDANIEHLLASVPSLLRAFRVTQKIGEGTFSTVFKANPVDSRLSHVTVALKHIIPASKPQRTENEVKCLKDLDGRDNVCPILSCIRENDHLVLVMPHMPHDRFQDYMLDMDVDDVKDYMWNLMLSLRKVHSLNIIHRDIKPANFLFNRAARTYCLVDFGLAHPIVVPTTPERSTGRRKSTSATVDAAALRKSPRKTCKPESYSEKILASPQKRKIEATESAALEESPKKREKRMTTSRPDLRGKAKQLFSPEKETGEFSRRHPPLPENDVHNVIAAKGTFKSPRRVLLQKRLADNQADGGAQPQLRPQSLMFGQVLSPAGRTLLSKHSSVGGSRGRLSSTSGPLRASHHALKSAPKCNCLGKNTFCSVCSVRPHQNANRAGTPGFRSPEVLLKSNQQGTAIDVWSAGVIFLSILSGCYPFFKASGDTIALAQIIALFGIEKLEKTASRLGKKLICSERAPAIDLRVVCERLRASARLAKFGRTRVEEMGPESFPQSAYDLLERLLDVDAHTRISAEEALWHPFLSNISEKKLKRSEEI